jgi:rifampin ADP-ribosylating transferase
MELGRHAMSTNADLARRIVKPDTPDVPVGDVETPTHVAVTYERCNHITGPFFHGTKEVFVAGDLITAGHVSNYHDGRISNHVYFAALIEPAIWGAELAVAFADNRDDDDVGRVYVVEPTGPFQDDPNVTNKRFPGNVTQSYRSRQPLRVIEEVDTWQGHSHDVVQGMLDGIAKLRAEGLDVIED